MGCLSSFKPSLPPEVEELLKEVTKRGDEIANKFLIEANQKTKRKSRGNRRKT